MYRFFEPIFNDRKSAAGDELGGDRERRATHAGQTTFAGCGIRPLFSFQLKATSSIYIGPSRYSRGQLRAQM